MLDEMDDGARIGVWTALGVVAFLLFGLIGGLALKTVHGHAKPAAAVALVGADTVVDLPLSGDIAGTLYFASGEAALPADAAATITTIKTAIDASGGRKIVLSGFHDATGDPAKNAELAKQRAIAVREALKAAGVDATRMLLRRPESTVGDGSNQEARRVEVRLAP